MSETTEEPVAYGVFADEGTERGKLHGLADTEAEASALADTFPTVVRVLPITNPHDVEGTYTRYLADNP